MENSTQKLNLEDFAGLQRAADVTGVARRTIYYWREKKIIATHWIGGKKFVSISEIIARNLPANRPRRGPKVGSKRSDRKKLHGTGKNYTPTEPPEPL